MSESWTFPWEDQARGGMDMPEGLPLADQMAYTTLRNIYGAYREKRLSREHASREKRLLRRKWEQVKEAEAFERKLMDHHARLIRLVERAACACRKEPTPENAVRLCDAVDGLEPDRTVMVEVMPYGEGTVL